MSAISESDSVSGLLAEPVFPCCHATDAALKAASLSLAPSCAFACVG